MKRSTSVVVKNWFQSTVLHLQPIQQGVVERRDRGWDWDGALLGHSAQGRGEEREIFPSVLPRCCANYRPAVGWARHGQIRGSQPPARQRRERNAAPKAVAKAKVEAGPLVWGRGREGGTEWKKQRAPPAECRGTAG